MRASDCLQRTTLPSPSPITVAHIGATVRPLPHHRFPLPPPLPSRFLLSPAKWMATLRRRSFSQPLPSQTRARARNTPRKTPEAIRGRPNRRRRRYASIRRRPRIVCLRPADEQQWGSSTRIRRQASRTDDPADPCEDAGAAPLVSVRRHVSCGVEVKGRSSIRRQIYAQPICVIRASRSKVRFVASPRSTPRIDPGSLKTVPWITIRV